MWVLLDTEPLESLQQSDEYALGRPLSRPPIPQIARAGLEPTPTHIGGPRPCTSCVYISVCAIMFRLGALWWGLHLRSQPTTSDRMLRLGPSMSVRARSSASRKHAPKRCAACALRCPIIAQGWHCHQSACGRAKYGSRTCEAQVPSRHKSG